MVDPDRRPTAQEIEELIDLVRRDPASPAFIDLGEAYLALGRPRDALGVGNLGLEAAPDNLEGRVMLARAHAALHQWKEAQGELLRVVKVDRSSRQGFALLGEVLLRRQDFERAVPVLQHAQNLDPTSPQILAMLKRARAGQPLDPPPPVPSPVPPRGETDNGQPIQRSQARRPPPQAQPVVPTAAPAQKTMALEPPPDWRNEPATEHMPPPVFHGAAAEPSPAAYAQTVLAPQQAMAAPPPAPRSSKPSSPPPPMSIEGVRPRIIQSKVQNAAAASLRQSAAVGESYLNDLLTGGLLDVAGVRVPDADFDLKPDRRWGRSTRRAFIFLFVVLVLGIGGGGTWYWWSEKQKAEAVARLQRESQVAIAGGDFEGFESCLKKMGEALDKDKTSLITYAYIAECGGLEALLYGTETDRVDQAYKFAKDLKPGEPGAREAMIGKAAVELSRLGSANSGNDATAIAQAAKSTLADVRKALDGPLAKGAAGDDKLKDQWVQWLRGRAMLAGGERKAARKAIGDASDAGLIIAMIESADLLVDDGHLDEALTMYDKASAKFAGAESAPAGGAAKDAPVAKTAAHPLIVIGRALGRAEASVANDDTIGELSVKLPKELPARLSAYRYLASSLANTGIESYPSANEALAKAVGGHPPNEPRFWARVAWAQYARGDLAHAVAARSRIVWFGQSKAEDDPVVQLVDAALLLASGLPDKALALAEKLQGVRPQLLRAYADLDLGHGKEAVKEAEAALVKAPDNVEAKILREQARMESSTGKELTEATEALEKLARAVKSKLGHHALGIALLANGNAKDAQTELEAALKDVGDDSPNPLVYRTHTALAQILLDNGDIAGAGKALDESLKVNSGYFPTRELQAKVVLRHGEPQRALEMLKPVFDEIGTPTPALRLLQAEALATRKDASAADKDNAIATLKSLKDQVPAGDLARAAAAIDPKLPKELGVAEPAAAPDPAKPVDKRKKR
ncbi:MAG TPA: tetratricopeptide repeat protein [Kofleriaceae bacterium]|nr:tetratricopeptide repeat protein [Kofleriaceae bacterium]